jgi:hypothetical protein
MCGYKRVALEHHRDVPVTGGDLVDHLAADPQLARGDVLESGDHVQRRRLAAAGRADEDHELAIGDAQVEVLDGFEAVRIALDHLVEDDVRHISSFSP